MAITPAACTRTRGAGSPTQLRREFQDYTIGPFPCGQVDKHRSTHSASRRPSWTIRQDAESEWKWTIRFERSDPLDEARRCRQAGVRGCPGAVRTYTSHGVQPNHPTNRVANSQGHPGRPERHPDPGQGRGCTGGSGRCHHLRLPRWTGADPPLARERGIAVLLGIFNPRDRVEVDNAARLLERAEPRTDDRRLLRGNKALTFRRANLEEIQNVCGRAPRGAANPHDDDRNRPVVRKYGIIQIRFFSNQCPCSVLKCVQC